MMVFNPEQDENDSAEEEFSDDEEYWEDREVRNNCMNK